MLVSILFSLPFVHLSVRTIGLHRTQSILSWLGKFKALEPPEDTKQHIARARHLIRYTRKNGPFKGNCLSRSLLMMTILKRQGINSQLLIGVRFEGSEFKAHAWLERNGKPLNESKDVRQRFSVFTGDVLPKETQFV